MSETLALIVPEQRRRKTAQPTQKGRWQGEPGKKVATLVVLILAALFVLLPLYVVLTTAFKTTADARLDEMWGLPPEWSLSGISQAWTQLRSSLGNSVILVIPATLISVGIGSINGYVLAKFPPKYANATMIFMLLGMFIPYQVILIPLVQTLNVVGLYGNILGLILTHIVYGIPITTLIFRNYYMTVPDELIEAASMDGSGFWSTYGRVILPISIPGFVVGIIFQFTSIWNEFLFALVVVPNPAAQPITVALNNLSGTFSVQWNVIMAGAILTALPTAIVYFALGKYFVNGLMAGSIKG